MVSLTRVILAAVFVPGQVSRTQILVSLGSPAKWFVPLSVPAPAFGFLAWAKKFSAPGIDLVSVLSSNCGKTWREEDIPLMKKRTTKAKIVLVKCFQSSHGTIDFHPSQELLLRRFVSFLRSCVLSLKYTNHVLSGSKMLPWLLPFVRHRTYN